MRLKLISLEKFGQELARAALRSPNQVEIELVENQLVLGSPNKLRDRLQARIDRVDSTQPQAVLLSWGFPLSRLAGLRARTLPLVLPRFNFAHVQPASRQRKPLLRDAAARLTSGLTLGRAPAQVKDLQWRLGAFPVSASAWVGGRFGAKRSRQPGRCTPVLPRAHPLRSCHGWFFQRLMDGYWSYPEFLVVPPGWHIARATAQDGLVSAEQGV